SLGLAERECGAEVKGNRDRGDGDDVCASGVQQMKQHVRHNSADESLWRNGAHPAYVPWKQAQEPREKDEQSAGANQLRQIRIDRARTPPAHSQEDEKYRDEEDRDSKDLEREVRTVSADHADPVVRGSPSGSVGGGVQLRIGWRIGSEREEKEE